MTRKDYIGLAEALRAACPPRNWHAEAHVQWRKDCYAVAGYLGACSSAFDRARFLTACGVQS